MPQGEKKEEEEEEEEDDDDDDATMHHILNISQVVSFSLKNALRASIEIPEQNERLPIQTQ